jgi:hypothetical protein
LEKSAVELKNCKVCDAPLALSASIKKKEGKIQSDEQLKRCVFCSTPVGSEYRPFEQRILNGRRLTRMATFVAFIVFLFVIFAAFTAQREENCRRKPVAERLADRACVQQSDLVASNASLRLGAALSLPDQQRLMKAVDSNSFHVKSDSQTWYAGNLPPVRLSPLGKWLLLRHADWQLGIYPITNTPPKVTAKLNSEACQLNERTPLLDVLWSPDEQRALLIADLDGVRRVKLIALDARDMNAIRIGSCTDAYSQNVRAVAWLDNTHLIYLTEGNGGKRVEVRAADDGRLIFASALQGIVGTLNDLSVSPSGRYALFTVENADQRRQLYWLDLSAQPVLHTIAEPQYHARAGSFLSWANAHQVLYLKHDWQLALLDLNSRAISSGDVPPEIRKEGRLVWLAWLQSNN